MNKDLFRTYQTACLVGPMLPLLGETLDQFEGNSVITTYAPELRPSSPWRKQIVEGWTIISVDHTRFAASLIEKEMSTSMVLAALLTARTKSLTQA